MKREDYWFWLCNAPGIYRDDIRRLLKPGKSPEDIYQTDKRQLLQQKLISVQQKRGLEETMGEDHILSEKARLQKEGIRFLCPDSPAFPERLRLIPDAPYGLYVKGELPEEALVSVGMVGARAASDYGKRQARRFAAALAARGIPIISGMAAGIDGISAEGALSVDGKTFAVLGCGVDVVYPFSHISLYHRILESGGGIISEYQPGVQPVAWQFPYRNRLISGLSDCLLVMEARERSGTSITVRYALDQGRDVYALPGRLTDRNSVGCNRMIAEGAGILLDPETLLAELLTDRGSEGGALEAPSSKEGSVCLPARYRGTLIEKIYNAMGEDPESVYSIVEKIRETPENAMAALCEMELSGLVEETAKNIYVKAFSLDTSLS